MVRSGSRLLGQYLLLFAALTVVYHSNLRPVASRDTLPAALIPFSLWLDGSVQLDRFVPWVLKSMPEAAYAFLEKDGRWYSAYPVAGPLFISVAYWPLALFPSLRDYPPESLVTMAIIVEKFASAFLAALSACLMFAVLSRVASRKAALFLAVAYALATNVWSTASQAMWQHTPGILALAGALLFWMDWSKDPGRMSRIWGLSACACAAVMLRTSNAILLPALGIGLCVLRAPVRVWLRVFPLPLLGLAIVAAYDIGLTGRLGGKFYNSPFQALGNVIPNLAGVLFSPGRGLFFYTPMLALALGSLSTVKRLERWKVALFAVCWTFVILQSLVVSAWPMWWGSYCWGPRLWTEALPFGMPLLALAWPVLSTACWRGLIAVFVAWGVFVQVLGVYYVPNGNWNSHPVSVDRDTSRLWDWRDNPVGRTWSAGPMIAPYVIVWTGLREGRPAAMQKIGKFRAKAAGEREFPRHPAGSEKGTGATPGKPSEINPN